jgi:hypothetical protein
MKHINKYTTALIYFIITLILYWPSKDGKFVGDTLYYLEEIKKDGFRGIFTSYDMIFHWQFPCLVYYLLHKIFGVSWLGWHLVFSFLHSINAILIKRVLENLLPKKYFLVALFASFLFLVSPFQSEVVAWGATLHYLLIVLFFLLSILSIHSYYTTQRNLHLYLFHVYFILSLWCFEQAFLFPIVYILYYFFFLKKELFSNWKNFFIKFTLGNFIIIALYFIATKLYYGVWIAHYGAKTHTQIDFGFLYQNLINYLNKFFFYYRDLPETLRVFLNKPIFSVIIPLGIVALLGLFYYVNRTDKKLLSILLFLLLTFGAMLVPVLNLDHSFTFELQSDRYGYIASAFFYPFICLLVMGLLGKRGLAIFFIVSSMISIPLLIQNNIYWGKSGEIGLGLIKNYPLKANQKAIILNLPDNYKGAYCLRNGLPDGLHYFKNEIYKPNILTVAMVNILSKNDETEVSQLDSNIYYVKCKEYGKWYYHQEIKKGRFEKLDYSIDYDEWNTAYTLQIKSNQDTLYILKCEGVNWAVIDTLLPQLKN